MAAKQKRRLKARRGGSHLVRARRHNSASRRHYRLRRRQNPFGFSTPQFLELSGFAIVGGIVTRAVPQFALPQYNSGLPGYGLNGLTAALAAFLAGKYSKEAGLGTAIGGAVMIAGRIVSDFWGKQLVTFSLLEPSTGVATPAAVAAAPTTGLSQGDLHFDLRGYKQTYFPLPTKSGADLVTATPWSADLAKVQAMVSTKGKGQVGVKPTSLRGGRYAYTM